MSGFRFVFVFFDDLFRFWGLPNLCGAKRAGGFGNPLVYPGHALVARWLLHHGGDPRARSFLFLGDSLGDFGFWVGCFRAVFGQSPPCSWFVCL